MAVPAITREKFDAVLFDLDGVLTSTAKVHAAAWKEAFDVFLKNRAELHNVSFVPFDIGEDYRRYVDGKPRLEGIQSFLASRNIHLDYGTPSDLSTAETVCGLGNQKNKLVKKIIERDGVEAYPGTAKVLDFLRRQ